MSNPTLSEALTEAYAIANSNEVIFDTIELQHPGFLDDDGDEMGVRVVRDKKDLIARLEPTAKINPGEVVTFTAMAFEIDYPEITTTPVPEITVTIDNVTRELIRYLDIAAASTQKINVIHRIYLSTDLQVPQITPPLSLTLYDVEANIFRVTAKAKILDVGNLRFPLENYDTKKFIGLKR